MASVLRMPGVSADSEEAALVEWSVAVGDEVRSGDPVAVVETEKANVDIESDVDATVWRLLAEAGESVIVGNPIAVLLAAGEGDAEGERLLDSLGLGAATPAVAPAAEPTTAPTPAETPAAPAAEAPEAVPAATSAVAGDAERTFASPIARRLARQAGLEIDALVGRGPGGRIVRRDVEEAIKAVAAAPAPAAPAPAAVVRADPAPAAGDIPHTPLRRAVANALTGSKRDAPHFYLTAKLRADALLDLRERINEQSAVRVSINDLVIKAMARALSAVPEMNVIWTPDAVRRFDQVDIAVAIGSEKGLVTPVLRGVDSMPITEITTRVRDFVERANAGRLKQNELEGGTMTVSNLGMFGVDSFSAIINPPHVAILAVGAVVQEPIVVDGELAVGRTITVTASVDHRPVDGVLAAQWLSSFRGFIEQPLTIVI